MTFMCPRTDAWLTHVQVTYMGDEATAHANWVWVPIAQRDQHVDAARDLHILEHWLIVHGHPMAMALMQTRPWMH